MSWIRWLLDQVIDDPAFRQDVLRFATVEERSAHHHRLVERPRRQLSVAELAQASNLPTDQFRAVLDLLVRQHLVLIQP